MADYNFQATPTLNDGVVQWQLCFIETGQPTVCNSPTSAYPNVSVPQNHANQLFSFKIVNDNTQLGITFAPDNPLWIKANSKPTGPGVNGQITGIGGGATPELQFTDKNSSAVTLKYQLNFVDKNGNKVTAIDPDIKNGGKVSAQLFNSPIAILIGAAILITLAVFFWNRIKPRVPGSGGPAAGGGNPGG